MCEEGAAKLRLKPRTAPPARGRERSPGPEPPPRPQVRLTGAQKYFLFFAALEFGKTEGTSFLDSDPRKSIRKNAGKAIVTLTIHPSPGIVFIQHYLLVLIVPRIEALTDRCSWFEKEDLNECEKTWLLLLKDISQDSHCTNWDTVPSFPEFLEKKQQEKSPEHQEVFTVGIKDFEWVSFPSFHKDKCLNPTDVNSQQPTQSHSNELHKGQGQADKLKSLSAAEKTCRGTSTDQAKSASGADAEGVSELDVSPRSHKLLGHSSSAQPSALLQSPAQALSPQQHQTGAAQKSRKEKGEEKPQTQTQHGDLPLGVPAEELGSAPGAESHQERKENQGEAAAALDSCPMCLMQFSGRLSQLDIDGHLARCLSESADDVMW